MQCTYVLLPRALIQITLVLLLKWTSFSIYLFIYLLAVLFFHFLWLETIIQYVAYFCLHIHIHTQPVGCLTTV